MKYRKKPVVIEAFEYAEESLSTINALKRFVGKSLISRIHDTAWLAGTAPAHYELIIRTFEGDHQITLGDFIIKGVAGEFYPCKPDIFRATYEEVIDCGANEFGEFIGKTD